MVFFISLPVHKNESRDSRKQLQGKKTRFHGQIVCILTWSALNCLVNYEPETLKTKSNTGEYAAKNRSKQSS
jgi:hypothetical protein